MDTMPDYAVRHRGMRVTGLFVSAFAQYVSAVIVRLDRTTQYFRDA
jgi:hypothetical protein